ncbi:hypothetical protein Leryth_026725 [Lithospermum erythrorhizon]|nr:hypothetical protein Leryth_026725 [Lithospermum erythrorhizon]
MILLQVLTLILLDLPGFLFFSTYTLARSLPTDKLRCYFISINSGIYFIQWSHGELGDTT